MVAVVIDQGGYGADAAAPVVRKVFDYLRRPSGRAGQVRSAATQPWRTIVEKMTAKRPSLWPRIEPLLAHVEKPARYIGGELGSVEPAEDPGRIAWLLVYPDTYEIGLPNQGLQILYEILNERPDAVAERAYAPWQDMEALMRANDVPLFSLESHRPAGSFDVIAFNWAAELTATNILNLIDLAGVPVRSADRRAGRSHGARRRALRVQPGADGGLRRRLRARRRRGGRGRVVRPDLAQSAPSAATPTETIWSQSSRPFRVYTCRSSTSRACPAGDSTG